MRRTIRTLLCFAVALSPMLAAGQTSDAVEKKIDALNETDKAILKELQEIHKLLQQQQQAPGAAAADALPATPMDISREAFKGAPNAKVAIIEFSDYQCPFCARYDSDAYPQIIKDYVDTGKVKYVWRDLPLDMHQNAFKAAEAAQCARDQGKFWEMHDLLFKNQQSLALTDLPKHAEAVKLNPGTFQQCLDSGKHAGEIKDDIAVAGTVGISGTPSFLLGVVLPNGTVKVAKKIVGAQPYANFKSAIDSLLTP